VDGWTDGDIRAALTLVGVLLIGAIWLADIVGARRHRNVHRRRASGSLLDPREHRPAQLAIDYKHLDARRTWRSILEREAE
jgi:hypothetical protein